MVRVAKLTADGREALAKREAMREAYLSKVKFEELKAQGEASIAKREALKKAYESTAKYNTLKAEGEAVLAKRNATRTANRLARTGGVAPPPPPPRTPAQLRKAEALSLLAKDEVSWMQSRLADGQVPAPRPVDVGLFGALSRHLARAPAAEVAAMAVDLDAASDGEVDMPL